MSHEAKEVIQALVDLCVGQGVRTLVQVGAGDGYEADAIRRATGCQAICLEPDAKCAPMDPALEWHEVLIGATNSVVDFYVHESLGLSSEIKRDDGKEIRVSLPQVRLDSFCAQQDIWPDALLIDTEGTTLDVLEGAGALLADVNLIYAECQTAVIRPGMRLLGEVDAFLVERSFRMRPGLPTYDAGGQGNYTWLRL